VVNWIKKSNKNSYLIKKGRYMRPFFIVFA